MTRRGRRNQDPSPSGIGDVLGAARRGMGVPLEHAAAATHLRESYLAALERDDVERLGLDPAYVRGTVRTYAEFLGLDTEALLARQRTEAGSDAPSGSTARAPVERVRGGAGEPAPRRTLGLAAGAIGLLIIAVVAFTVGQTLARRMARSTSAGAARAAADDEAVLAGSAAASDAPTAPATGSSGGTRAPATLMLRMQVVEPTWVKVVTDGMSAQVGRVDRSVERFHAERRITVRTAVPGAVKLTFNGVAYGRMARNRDGPVKIACDAADGCEVVK